MKVLNVHTRDIAANIKHLESLISTLATEDDQVWPQEKWPRMKLSNGLNIGSEGGHGPIRYRITHRQANRHLIFTFQQPEEFYGFHAFELEELEMNKTRLRHTIDMKTKGIGAIQWIFVIRWLHDALIEDAFDKVENQLFKSTTQTRHSIWVTFLRRLLGSK